MTDEGPQQPPRGRRARGSVDPGSDYPGDLPRRAYPPPQYPESVPGQRSRAAPGDPQAAQDYPAPPGTRGRLAGDAAPGHGRAGPPGESAAGYGPRTPAGSRRPVMAGWHPRTMGGPDHPGRRPAATTRRAHPGSRHLAGLAVRARRRVGTDLPVRRARQPPVRDAERTPARAGGATRRPPRADRTLRPGCGRARAGPRAERPGRAGGPQHPVRSPAGRAWMVT